MDTILRVTIVVLAFVLLSGSCIKSETSQQRAPDADLVVLPGAVEVKQTKELDGSVEYLMDDPYPGSVVIARIAERMKAAGWSPTDEWIFEQPPVPKTEEWSRYLEGTDEIFAKAIIWQKKTTGDLVTYFLTYRVAPPGARATRMHVKALRASAETVKRLRALKKK